MDNHAPSFLPARRVVSGEVFKPEVGERSGFLGITIRVDLVPSIETTCVDVTPKRVGGDPELNRQAQLVA